MKHLACRAVASACLLTLFGIAQASSVDEIEPNDSLATAQRVDIPDNSVTISGVIGTIGQLTCDPSAPCDNDFYTFYGQEGDVVTLNIDGGWGGAQNVDTVIALFAADGTMLLMNDDAPDLVNDPGSTSTSDARIDNFRLPATGFYVVGVSSYPRYFSDGGVVSFPTMGGNGDYKLVISGVSAPPVANAPMQINIDIKPHDRRLTRVDPRSKHLIPVALLSSSEFNAVTVDQTSLTFGATGDEHSLARCRHFPEDVNHDGLLDLVCFFKNQLADFQPGDLEGILRGTTGDGRAFEGHGLLKVVPEKHRGEHRHGFMHGHDRDHDRDHDHD
jgi:Bacterial pre-peptidase C-terminal domain